MAFQWRSKSMSKLISGSSSTIQGQYQVAQAWHKKPNRYGNTTRYSHSIGEVLPRNVFWGMSCGLAMKSGFSCQSEPATEAFKGKRNRSARRRMK